MRATGFEVRHPLLLHQMLVGAAFLTYLADRDDVVWRFIKGSTHVRLRERVLFGAATLLLGVGAWLCTRGRMRPQSPGVERARLLGEFCTLWRLRPWRRWRAL